MAARLNVMKFRTAELPGSWYELDSSAPSSSAERKSLRRQGSIAGTSRGDADRRAGTASIPECQLSYVQCVCLGAVILLGRNLSQQQQRRKVFVWSPSERPENGAVRVTVSMTRNGSRTVYEFDDAQHKAIATSPARMGNSARKFATTSMKQVAFSSGTIFGLMAIFVLRAVQIR